MAILKRFEIWLLLGLMTAAVVFALKTDPQQLAPEPEPIVQKVIKDEPINVVAKTDVKTEAEAKGTKKKPEKEEVEPKLEPAFRIEKVSVTQTQQGMIVGLTLLGQAEGGEVIDFNTNRKVITVTTDSGDVVERFFSPFPEPAVMDAEEKSLVNLKYWLKDSDTRTLWVSIFDHKLKAELPE